MHQTSGGTVNPEPGWECKGYPGWGVIVAPPVRKQMSSRGIRVADLRKVLGHYDTSWTSPDPTELRVSCQLLYRKYVHAICCLDDTRKIVAVKAVGVLPTVGRMRQ